MCGPLRAVLASVFFLCLQAPEAFAPTAPDLSSRIVIDGFADDFAPDESVFGNNPDGSAQESDSDSQWGPTNDIHQIRITWDRAALYFAAEGIIWDNNMVIVLDAIPGRGLRQMSSLNSWRRNVEFAPVDFGPDVIGGTWDGNTRPRLLIVLDSTTVDDQVPGTLFQAASTFLRAATGRAMEFRVPWTTLFAYGGGVVARDTVIDGVRDTVYFLPAGSAIRIAGFVAGGADGTGGPDVAPNNTTGCSVDGNQLLVVDNDATIGLDMDGDGLPDMNASPGARVMFRVALTAAERRTWGQLKLRYR